MATAGHMCESVEKHPRAFQSECPICLQVLREPYQATCCGVNFCKECIHRVKAANEPCPVCREKDFHLFHDKGLQRVLYNSRVDCTNKSEGCEWTGELRELDNHLNLDPSALEGCPYALIKCPLGCAEYIYRKDVKDHAARAHAMAGGENSHVGGDGARFTMNNFEEYKRDNGTWYSPHFYTHPNGYKMCLRIDANGSASGRGTHLSVFVCLMQGEFDDQLKWPFQENISIMLVNQEEDGDHVIKRFYSGKAPSKCCERMMTKGPINNAWGTGQFLSHAELQPKYLKNDCIKFYLKTLLIEI